MCTAKITFKIVRAFSIGFTIHSPKLNGFSCAIYFGCFTLSLWGKGKKLFSAKNYWHTG